MTANATPTPDADLRLVITRNLNAPAATVYRAWTDPQQMVKWWGPENVECRRVDLDLKVGGAYRIHMTSPKGDHIAIGKYLEIVPNQRLRLTWSWENYAMPQSVLTVEFEDLGKTTRLTLTHVGLPDREDVEQHTEGWNSLVEKLAGLFDGDKAALK